MYVILLSQDLKAQLEELDVQTQSIDSHVSSLASATPSGEDEVHMYVCMYVCMYECGIAGDFCRRKLADLEGKSSLYVYRT